MGLDLLADLVGASGYELTPGFGLENFTESQRLYSVEVYRNVRVGNFLTSGPNLKPRSHIQNLPPTRLTNRDKSVPKFSRFLEFVCIRLFLWKGRNVRHLGKNLLPSSQDIRSGSRVLTELSCLQGQGHVHTRVYKAMVTCTLKSTRPSGHVNTEVNQTNVT
ncbi:hypothetical protein Bbelb_002020 [Branchiostoma belcheri]|nr:hypothetical protein Bbelb_002020 [Branchiostoma belcheri]